VTYKKVKTPESQKFIELPLFVADECLGFLETYKSRDIFFEEESNRSISSCINTLNRKVRSAKEEY